MKSKIVTEILPDKMRFLLIALIVFGCGWLVYGLMDGGIDHSPMVEYLRDPSQSSMGTGEFIAGLAFGCVLVGSAAIFLWRVIAAFSPSPRPRLRITEDRFESIGLLGRDEFPWSQFGRFDAREEGSGRSRTVTVYALRPLATADSEDDEEELLSFDLKPFTPPLSVSVQAAQDLIDWIHRLRAGGDASRPLGFSIRTTQQPDIAVQPGTVVRR